MENIIEVKDLCKTYIVNSRQNNVLRNVNFSLAEGEMLAVMGPSGSGKSTLLYTVSGMDEMTAGEVIFDGKSLSKLSQAELSELRLDHMGFIFQQMYMLKNLTILDNILLPSCQSKKISESRQEKTAGQFRHTAAQFGCNGPVGHDRQMGAVLLQRTHGQDRQFGILRHDGISR